MTSFLTTWDAISRTREAFLVWIQEHVLAPHSDTKRASLPN